MFKIISTRSKNKTKLINSALAFITLFVVKVFLFVKKYANIKKISIFVNKSVYKL
nr:MAG TPA: hypothetical protein [Caudoviricetes sp.]